MRADSIGDLVASLDAGAIDGEPVMPSSHGVYRCEVGGSPVAAKVFRIKHGDELEREWAGLSHLSGHGVAPEPIARGAAWIVMSWLDGEPRRDLPDALGAPLRRMHAMTPPAAMPVARSSPAMIRPRIDAKPVPDIAAKWLATREARRLETIELPDFVRGDGNLNNFMWDDSGVPRFIDFEDCGRGDWVCDLADLVEHVQSRVIPDERWDEFVDMLEPDRARFDAARRFYAIWWLVARPGREEHAARVEHLLQ